MSTLVRCLWKSTVETSSKVKYSLEYFQTDEWQDELSEARRHLLEARESEIALRLVVESGDVPFHVELELEHRCRETRKCFGYLEALIDLPTSGTQLIIWMDKWES